MSTTKQKVRKIFGKVGLTFLGLLILLTILLNSSFLQIKFVNYWLNQQSKTMGIAAQVQSVNVDLFSRRVSLTGLEVYDHHQNLLLDIGALQTSIRSFSALQLNLGTTHISNIVLRLHRYQLDSVSNLQQIINFFTPSPPDPNAPEFTFKCTAISLENGDLSYVDEKRSLGDTFQSVDFNHVFLTDVNLWAQNVDVAGDNILANIKNLQFKEHRGFEVSKITARLNLSSAGIIARKTRIITPLGDLDFDMRFTTTSWTDYSDFISKVRVFAKFRKSDLNLKELVHFAPALEGMYNHFYFSGSVSGYVDDFQTKDFKLSYGKNTGFDGDVLLSGLPDFNHTFFKLSINNLTTSPEDAASFLLPKAKKINFPEELNKLGFTQLSGQLSGYPDNLNAAIGLISEAGSIQTAFKFSRDTVDKAFDFSGYLEDSQLALGLLLDEKTLGNNIGLSGSFDGRFSSKKSLDLSAQIICENVEYQRRLINTVSINGNWTDQFISALISIDDNSGNAEFSGELSIDPKNPYVDVTGFFRDVDLVGLRIINDTNRPLFSSNFSAKIYNSNIDSLIGHVNLSNLQMALADTAFRLNNLSVSQQILQEGIATKINCDFFKADVFGNYKFSNLEAIWDDIQNNYLSALNQSIEEIESSSTFTLYQDPVKKSKPKDSILQRQTLDLTLNVFKTGGILSYFLPDVYLPDGADVEFNYNVKNHQHISLNLSAKNASAFDVSVSHLDLKGHTEDSTFLINLNAKDLYFVENRYCQDISLMSKLKNNFISWQLEWLGMPDQPAHMDGSFEGNIQVLSKDKISLNIQDSRLFFVDQVWQFEPDNTIMIDSIGIHFKNIRFFNQNRTNEYLSLNGHLSKDPNSRLDLAFNQYQLGTWASFIKPIGLDINGAISGEINIFDFHKNPYFNTDLKIEDFSINHFNYGTALLQTVENLFTLNIQDDTKTYLSAKGDLFPNRTDKNFNVRISVPELDLSFLSNYVESFSSSLTGKIGGELILGGTFKKPQFYGDLIPRDVVMKVDFLNTFYAVTCQKIAFSLDSIVFVSAKVEDTLYKTQGALSGGLYHNRFSNIQFNLDLQMDKLFVLNTSQLLNEDFFGKAFATGLAHLGGTSDNILINIQGRTEKGTEIKVNYHSKVNISETNHQFIQFVTPKKDSTAMLHTPVFSERSPTNIAVKLNIDATPDASFFFDMNIPPTVGLINASGNGNLRLNYESRGNIFTMFGDYVLQEGYYDFSFEEKSLGRLISRRFYIERGGSLQWTGDPSNMILDISAVYSTRASLYPVLSANYVSVVDNDNIKRKTNVQSIISIDGRMTQPNIKFDFRLPNVDEDTRTQFFSLVNKENESEMSKQTFYLLLLGGFTATGSNSNIATSGSNTSAINATTMATEVLSNQINSILQNVSNNVSVNLNYKPEDLNSTQQTQLSLGTQLFDNRLLIDGNFGTGGTSKDLSVSSEQQTIEFNAEWRITDRFSLKGFNRSNDRDFLRPQPGYSQGIGISYKRDFNSLRALFSKKKKNGN